MMIIFMKYHINLKLLSFLKVNLDKLHIVTLHEMSGYLLNLFLFKFHFIKVSYHTVNILQLMTFLKR